MKCGAGFAFRKEGWESWELLLLLEVEVEDEVSEPEPELERFGPWPP